ncbi:MAG: DUF3198 domain-containing protein [Thermoplasmata archaeon]
MKQKVIRELILPGSIIILIFSILGLIFGILSFWYLNQTPEALRNAIVKPLNDTHWDLWLLILSPLGICVGGYYLYDNVSMRLEFDRLYDTPSKKKFIENIDRLEYLAWNLSRRHEIRVERRKKEYNIKT